jgi:Ser/Thr protein kinase RdoA (MazF antagonist)
LPDEDLAVITHLAQKVFSTRPHIEVNRVTEGVSTIVYCIQTIDGIFYLRIWPELGESFAPEVSVHQQLRSAGLHVPEVIHYEHYNEVLQRSLMITTEVPGRAIGYQKQPPMLARILREVGHELAIVNQLPVQGYGWIQRSAPIVGPLQAEYETLPAWLEGHFREPLRALGGCSFLAPHIVDRLLTLLDRAKHLFQDKPAVLAHGDFDVTHIYHRKGIYTGIIDFGEIRGTHLIYDLAHFAIENHDLLAYLLEGYKEVTRLEDETLRHIYLTGILIAARRIGQRVLQGRPVHRPDVAYVLERLSGGEVD